MRLFSYKNRPVHLGPYPLERLKRQEAQPDLFDVPVMQPLAFLDDESPESLANPMALFIGMLDAIRDGLIAEKRSEIPSSLEERSDHLKAAGYYFDATQAGICALPKAAFLEQSFRNPVLDQLLAQLEGSQPKTLASGIDVVMADVKESAKAKPAPMDHHGYAVVYLVEHPRDPDPEEPGSDWITGTLEQRSAVRAAETAVVLANYLRILGFEARAHTASSSDVDLGKLALAAGLVEKKKRADGSIGLSNPYVGERYSLAAITTTLELAPDLPLAPRGLGDRWRSHGPAWWLGKGSFKSLFNRTPYRKRPFAKGALPFEKIRQQEEPTTFIDSARVPRVPKRTDMFARALFGDMGKVVQEGSKNGCYVLKNPMGYCSRRALGALILLQDGQPAAEIAKSAQDSQCNADNVKASLYYLGADAVGLSPAPDWTYYSHDAAGNEIEPYHKNAISILIDQGHETMDATSGDDWISAAQSMRAYLRSSLIGGIVAEQIRRLGYGARVHSVLDGEVLQPPLLLLSGLGEVSRIGEVILNPYLGPRLKSGVVTTDMPFVYDKPINFGMQTFCENCNKCARECPAGAITAGPKVMFNGYEIWKSDSERCARYRITNLLGSMCGRCMKTCPWNLEGLFKEAPFRWLAMHYPKAAKWLARLDDRVGNGQINKVKKWWWDLELQPDGRYIPAKETNARALSLDLDLKPEDQTLAVYPAHLAPPPYPVPFPMDREAGLEAFQALLSPEEHKARLAKGETEDLVPQFRMPEGPPPVMPVTLSKKRVMAKDIACYEFVAPDGADLPSFDAGAHIDVVVAPEYFRQYSLAGDPADRSKYVIGVLEEKEGKGGSKLMHRIFEEGRKVFISPPRNHFPLADSAGKTLLIGGGIGVTPLIAMAHQLHAKGADFSLFYCARQRERAGFVEDLEQAPWRDRVRFFFSAEGKRADLDDLLAGYGSGDQLYTCGSSNFMDAVFAAAEKNIWPEDALHREYFSVPDDAEYENHEFTVRLANDGRSFDVPAEKSIVDVLGAAGIHIDVKCSEGICGVCVARYTEGDVEHRDFVLGKKERVEKMMTCCSRAREEGGEVVLDL
ncbi:2Fe-2S iron-sulfur cluster-binding protein [Denitrobaculum tricleocarpae]|uniref:2Fe-2S iron-sulfur cluster binding domain-containing protein n=1 Tax=Denitrobaculum tricleocarpae TaxID=2591009 RepID=A0A545TAR4_9PROT|nr:2Fe-2S iron-sulfur cluster-binding protein [Denitrobaculum tricleocarpae]TQV74313.1 2Fe-2S iron-sulfur cluster binding domain-containing protein [Denitrobaculum tricleocarpae]